MTYPFERHWVPLLIIQVYRLIVNGNLNQLMSWLTVRVVNDDGEVLDIRIRKLANGLIAQEAEALSREITLIQGLQPLIQKVFNWWISVENPQYIILSHKLFGSPSYSIVMKSERNCPFKFVFWRSEFLNVRKLCESRNLSESVQDVRSSSDKTFESRLGSEISCPVRMEVVGVGEKVVSLICSYASRIDNSCGVARRSWVLDCYVRIFRLKRSYEIQCRFQSVFIKIIRKLNFTELTFPFICFINLSIFA